MPPSSIVISNYLNQTAHWVFISSTVTKSDMGDITTGYSIRSTPMDVRITNNDFFLPGATVDRGFRYAATHLMFTDTLDDLTGGYVYTTDDYGEYEILGGNDRPGGLTLFKEVFIKRENNGIGTYYNVTSTNLTKTSIKIWWTTRIPTDRKILYGTSPDVITTPSNVYSEEEDKIGHYGITLSGLSEDTTYYVELYSQYDGGEIISETYSFTTLDAGGGGGQELVIA